MKIATYNINSIRARAANLWQWLKNYNLDIVFLQEIKCESKDFPYFECEALGYKVAVFGQKSYNGVAVLSKYDFEITAKNLPTFQSDDSMRYLEILVKNGNSKFWAASVYAPNGCSPDKIIEKEKLAYKLKWFDCLHTHILSKISSGIPFIIGGDFNVMMSPLDVYAPQEFAGSPLYSKPVWDKINAIIYSGAHDAFRLLHPKDEGFTFWDYTGNSFVTNSGLRIDYIFVSAQFAERLIKCEADKSLRMMDKPSDHTALIAEFEV